MPARPMALLMALLLALSAAACSSDDGGGSLEISDAWARPSTGVALAGAAYLTIRNDTGDEDALLRVTTPAATTPEIHETMAGEGGMMAMQPVDRIEIPAGQTVKLEPGGYHIMLIGLTGDLVAGSSIQLTLEFEKAGSITVTAEVRAS